MQNNFKGIAVSKQINDIEDITMTEFHTWFPGAVDYHSDPEQEVEEEFKDMTMESRSKSHFVSSSAQASKVDKEPQMEQIVEEPVAEEPAVP